MIQQGETGQNFYIIIEGTYSVHRNGKEIARLKPRDLFGEFGTFSDKIRTATVQAVEDGKVLKLKKEDIGHIISSIPSLHFYINQIIKERGGDFLAIAHPN